MNREIRFRAWHKENKEMFEVGEMDFNFQSIYYSMGNISFDEFEIMQFTGLKDKNGKEIYEGDIVNIKGRKYIVEYWKGQLLVSWYLKSVRSGDTEYMELPVIGNGEVIGNIYDNPELIRRKNNEIKK